MFNTPYGEGSGPIFLDRISCKGNEATISECTHNNRDLATCTHADDISIQCTGKLITLELEYQCFS